MVCTYRWRQFRQSALARQAEIDGTLMRLQEEELGRIREWMTRTEDRISRLHSGRRLGGSLAEVEAQLAEHEELQREFEKREVSHCVCWINF